MKLLRINEAYFTEDNKFMMIKSFDGEWNVYKSFRPFMEYQVTFKYLKDAKKYLLSKYNKGE